MWSPDKYQWWIISIAILLVFAALRAGESAIAFGLAVLAALLAWQLNRK